MIFAIFVQGSVAVAVAFKFASLRPAARTPFPEHGAAFAAGAGAEAVGSPQMGTSNLSSVTKQSSAKSEQHVACLAYINLLKS